MFSKLRLIYLLFHFLLIPSLQKLVDSVYYGFIVLEPYRKVVIQGSRRSSAFRMFLIKHLTFDQDDDRRSYSGGE